MQSAASAVSGPRLDFVVCASPAGLHRMAYWEWGDPNNSRVLICVHGLTRTGRDFDALAQALSPYYRVICPDVVGRGKSDWLADPDGYIVPQYVADMFTLIARLRPSSLDWVGTSMGGLIGLGVAGSLLNAQQLHVWAADHALGWQWAVPFRRLVLNDVGPVINADGLVRIANYVGEYLEFDTLPQVIDYAKRVWGAFGLHTEAQWEHLVRYVFKEQDGKWQLAYDLGIATPFKNQFLEEHSGQVEKIIEVAQSRLWQAFEGIPAECLIVRGQTSDVLSNETAQEMLQRQPLAQLYEAPQVGHAPTLMQTDQIETVKQFLLKD